MSVQCMVCRHPEAGAIDEALRDGSTARAVAAEYALSYDAVTRHARNHLSRRTATLNGHAGGDPLDELVDALRTRALAGDPVVAREYRLALSAQQAAAHAAAPLVDFTTTPEWTGLRTRLLDALDPFPEARLAVVEALADD